jgi:hypothetical protein
VDDIEFFPSSVRQHPEFAAAIAYVIACGGFIDCTLASMLTLLLHAEPRAGTAMYMALSGAEARRAALSAAAKEVLTPENFAGFQDVLAKTKAARERRNDFAHHLWGFSKQIPDGLLLISPEAFAERDVSVAEVNREIAATKTVRLPAPLNPDEIQVYRKADFDESTRLLQAAVNSLDVLRIEIALSIGLPAEGYVEVGRTHPTQLDELLGEASPPRWNSAPTKPEPQSQPEKSPQDGHK